MQDVQIAQDDFDEAWYLSRYPDIGDAVRSGVIASGFLHFVKFGQCEGRAYRLCASNPVSALNLQNPAFRHRFYRCIESGDFPRLEGSQSVDQYLQAYFQKMELVRE